MTAIEAFDVSEEEALDIDELKETFPDVRDLRAALEDYFHIYDDYAVMTPQEFDTSFARYVKEEDEEEESNLLEDEYPEE